MENFKKNLLRLLLQNKRLLKKVSFIVILVFIPVLITAMRIVAGQESGVFNAALCSTDPSDPAANGVIEDLMNGDSVIRFTKCGSEDEATELVRLGKCDAAWVFESDLEENVDKFFAKNSRRDPFVRVIEREETVTSLFSHEKLYAAIYSEVTYSLLKNHVANDVYGGEPFDEAELRQRFEDVDYSDGIISYEYVDTDNVISGENYLTTPLRGLLASLIVFCSLAAEMYYLSDRKEGVYDWLPANRHVFHGMGLCFSAAFDSAAATVIALAVSGGFSTFRSEILSMLAYVVAVTAFCTLVGMLLNTPAKLGVMLPFLMIVMLVFSPTFFIFKASRFVQIFFPPFYYLNAIYSLRFVPVTLLYSAVVFAAVFILNALTQKNKAI